MTTCTVRCVIPLHQMSCTRSSQSPQPTQLYSFGTEIVRKWIKTIKRLLKAVSLSFFQGLDLDVTKKGPGQGLYRPNKLQIGSIVFPLDKETFIDLHNMPLSASFYVLEPLNCRRRRHHCKHTQAHTRAKAHTHSLPCWSFLSLYLFSRVHRCKSA